VSDKWLKGDMGIAIFGVDEGIGGYLFRELVLNG